MNSTKENRNGAESGRRLSGSHARLEKNPAASSTRTTVQRRMSASRGMEKNTIDKPSDHQRRHVTRRSSDASRRSRSGGDSLEASSFHVASTRTGTGAGGSRVRRAAPGRHKSSDNMELRGGRDDLGAATLHGNSVSRIRGGSKSSRTLDSHLGTSSTSGHNKASSSSSTSAKQQPQSGNPRRSLIKRAMSQDNVKPPEEYANRGGSSNKSNEPEPVRRGRRRHNPEPAVVEEEEEESSSSDESGTSFGEEDSDDDSSSSNFSGDDKVDDRGCALSKQHGSTRSMQQQQQPKRSGLLTLMRENQTVQLSDMQEKKNRRVLHYLLYQHKLNIDMVQMQIDIDDDIATNGIEQALSRPMLPLYVEPAN